MFTGNSVYLGFMAKKGSVLVCDDEEIMREVLETILSSAGYKVDLAKQGEEALELYSQRSYDVVLMDVSMPGIGGLTTLEKLIKLDPRRGRFDDHGLSQHLIQRFPLGKKARQGSYASRFRTNRSLHLLQKGSANAVAKKNVKRFDR